LDPKVAMHGGCQNDLVKISRWVATDGGEPKFSLEIGQVEAITTAPFFPLGHHYELRKRLQNTPKPAFLN
jgi:hypothetical protein